MLLRKVASQIKAHKVDEMMKMDYRIGIEIAVGKLQEMYYGSMCPGYLEVLKDNEEQLFEEYMKMNKICIPVISLYQSEKFSQDLSTLLGSLQPRHSFLNGEEIPDAKEVIAQRNALRYQLPLPFDLILEKDGRD